MLMVFQTSI